MAPEDAPSGAPASDAPGEDPATGDSVFTSVFPGIPEVDPDGPDPLGALKPLTQV